VRAAEYFVAPGGVGNGSGSFPFGRIQDALNAARAGDVITVAPGTYAESLVTVRSGSAEAPITLRATESRGVVVTRAARVLTVTHAYLVVEGLVFDGQYAADDTVRVASSGDFLVLRDTEVRHSSRDLVDMAAPEGVLIEGSLLHHALNATGGRTDAHGIVAGSVRNLVVRDTKIHTFSGDAIQLDPGRAAPGWDRITIERCQFWLEPLRAAENGFVAGTVPGENALDTKTLASAPRARVIVSQTEAWGFRGGLITNMAAFNVKENVDATFDRVTVSRSEIAFRLRGPGPNGGAWARVQNAVVYDVGSAVRYEDNIERVQVWNTTLGARVTRFFRAASSTAVGLDVRNVLFLGSSSTMPGGQGNMQAAASFFVNAGAHDYRLATGSPAIDAGVTVSTVSRDRLGVSRPQGAYWDVGAYERTQ
jgi:hypothetical protein